MERTQKGEVLVLRPYKHLIKHMKKLLEEVGLSIKQQNILPEDLTVNEVVQFLRRSKTFFPIILAPINATKDKNGNLISSLDVIKKILEIFPQYLNAKFLVPKGTGANIVLSLHSATYEELSRTGSILLIPEAEIENEASRKTLYLKIKRFLG